MGESITELQALWNRVLRIVKDELNDSRIYDAFIGDSYLVSYTNKTMKVIVNSMLAQNILSTKYSASFEKAASNVAGVPVKIVFTQSTGEVSKVKVEEEKPEFFMSSSIKSNLTFDNFVVGPCNKSAQQASLLIASNPGTLYNPLFLYGGSGLGKTHLLHAIANYIKENDPTKRILYCTSDDFISEFISYVRGESDATKLKGFICKHDVLLIDDIQQIAGKEQTEMFFFQVFTKMYNDNKQIVITSDKHPDLLKGFEERLKSRFQAGLTMDIKPPDQQTSVEITKSKIKSSPINLDSFDPEVIEFIASKFSKNIRSIDEALNKLVFYTTSINPTSHITIEIAQEALASLIMIKDNKTKITEQKIINAVADYYNKTPSQLTGRSRPADIALPRHICMYLIKELLDEPYAKIGMAFSGKDHSTVMSGVKKVEKELKTNTLLQTAVSDIKKILKQ